MLRAVRKLLRTLDTSLDAPEKSLKDQPSASNLHESEIAAFLSCIRPGDAGMTDYMKEHRERIVHTLSHLPLGGGELRALELGSYLHMSSVLERVLKYRSAQPAYYAPSIGRSLRSLEIEGEPRFTKETDLFDAEVHTYPYPDGAFEVILCCELIEHLLRDPMHLMLECRRVLVDDGLLVLTTPNVSSLTSVSAVLEGRRNPQVFARYPERGNSDVPHVREYTPYEIRLLLSAAGFEIEHLTTERLPGAQHSTWALSLLETSGFDCALRGEQIYCLARKRQFVVTERFPAFLYNS